MMDDVTTPPRVARRQRHISALPGWLWSLAGLTACIATIPLGYVLLRASQGTAAQWQQLWRGQVPLLMANTLVLAALVGLGAAVLGTVLAWIVERTSVPGRNVWRWVLALPLGMPPYVGAICYVTLLRPRGLLERWLADAGLVPLGTLPFRSFFGLGGAAFIIILCTYPYVYLLVSATLRQGSHHFEELARVSGLNPWRRFVRVVLPLLRPGIGAGALLAVLYTLSDFGVVALLRYQTFSVAVYNQFVGRLDRSGAAILSVPLVLLTLGVLAAESYASRRSVVQVNRSWRPARPHDLGRWAWVANGTMLLVAGLALAVPLALLCWWSVQSFTNATELSRIWSAERGIIWKAAWNSIWISAVAATLTLLLALAPALLLARVPGHASRILALLSQAGYALPGVVVSLSLVLLVNRSLPALAGSTLVLLLAYVVRFLPQALQAVHGAARAVSPTLDAASRTMGVGPFETFRRVTLPLMAPGLASGWALAFLTTMKELPSTLLLRPAGFDTLPVRIWIPASEAVYVEAAPAALVLTLCALLPLALMLSRRNARIYGL